MHQFFVHLYQYFQHRKARLVLLMTVVIGLSLFAISQIRLEEDISKIMPADDGINSINQVFEQTDIADRLAILVSLDSAISKPSSELLIAYCDSFISALPSYVDTSNIAEITYRLDESRFLEVYDFLYANLPLFLTEEDYTLIERSLKEDSVSATVNGIYRSLLTPGGSFMKRFAFRDPLSFTALALKHLQQFQLDENIQLNNGYFISKDERHLIFILRPKQSSKETKENAKLMDELDILIDGLNLSFDNVNAVYFGGVAVAVANAKQIRRDVTFTVTFALLALFSLILYFFRRINVFFYLILPTLIGSILALAIMYLLKTEVSIIAIGIGSVLIGITLDYSLHIFAHYRKMGNLNTVIKDLFSPIAVSSITTATAFMCLFFIRSEALKDLGLFAALSVMLTAFTALFLLPHLLPDSHKNGKSYPRTVIDNVAQYKSKFRRPLFLVSCLLTFIAIFYAPYVEFEEDLSRMNFMSEKLLISEAKLNRVTSATRKGVYLMNRGSELDQAISQAQRITPTLDSLKRTGQITNYTSICSTLPDSSTQLQRIQRWNQFWEKERKKDVGDWFDQAGKKIGFKSGTFSPFDTLLQKEFNILPYQAFSPLIDRLFQEFIFDGPKSTHILTIVRVDDFQSKNVYETFKGDRQVSILDKTFLVQRFVQLLKTDFDRLIFWSLIFIFFLLHLALGRLELALITFIPIAISWVWTLALMYLFDLKFNIINVIITSFIFGLGIDYSIFMMRGLMQKHKTGINNLPSFKTSILLSVITTLIGIGVMITAEHPALRSIAAVSIIGIVSVVILAFLIQPILYEWLIKDRSDTFRHRPLTLRSILRTVVTYCILFFGITFISCIHLLISIVPIGGDKSKKRITQWNMFQFSNVFMRILFFPNIFIQGSRQVDLSGERATIKFNNFFDVIIAFLFCKRTIVTISPHFKATHSIDRFFLSWLEKLSILQRKQDKALDPNYVFHPTDFSVQLLFRDDSLASLQGNAANQFPIHTLGTKELISGNGWWITAHDVYINLNEKLDPSLTNFNRRKLFERYLYKDNVLWFYMIVKVRLEKYYKNFDQMISPTARVVDLGCGYGFMSYMLHLCAPDRKITGIDYDADKVATAQHGLSENDDINFVHGNLLTYDLSKADVFILADVLHYFPEESQIPFLNRVADALLPGGKIILRDGDTDSISRHKKTRWTEHLSTGLGFNSTSNKLHFTSFTKLKSWTGQRGLQIKRIEESATTSNSIYIVEHLT